MTEYRKGLRGRIRSSALLILALLAAIAPALLLTPAGDERMSGFLRGFQVGGFAGLAMVAIVRAVRFFRALRDEERLKKLYVCETDERIRFIQDKIGGTGLNLTICLLGVAAIVAGYFQTAVFWTLFAATLAVTLLKLGLKLYYCQKF